MSAAERVVLTVGEREIFFVGCQVGMGKGAFKIAFFDMYDRVGACLFFTAYLTHEQIVESVLGLIFLTVYIEGETTVEEGIVPYHLFNIFHYVMIVAKDLFVGSECYLCAVFLFGINNFSLCQKHAF